MKKEVKPETIIRSPKINSKQRDDTRPINTPLESEKHLKK